ncbi:MAG: thioredoxin family protein [Candidatus Anstonellales archaeon]
MYFTSQYETVKVEKPLFEVHFFYSPTCPHCSAQKPFNEELMKRYPQVQWVYHDVEIEREATIYLETVERLKIPRIGTPTTVIGDCYSVGWESRETTGAYIEQCIKQKLENRSSTRFEEVYERGAAAERSYEIEAPLIGKIDLKRYSLPMLAVILGLIDGFNPCAMWVLVYLIGVVATLNEPKKSWLIVGTFLLASGVLYFLFMTAWLNFFLILGYVRLITVIVGVVAVGGGILSIKEYVEVGGRVTCKVDDPSEKKEKAGIIETIASSPLSTATIIAIVGLAFTVNSIEFICSSAIPAVFTQILALSNLSFLEYYGYILLYDIFYMLDDLIIFSLATFAISKIYIGEKYAGYCKIIGGLLLLILGLVLLFAPQLLR